MAGYSDISFISYYNGTCVSELNDLNMEILPKNAVCPDLVELGADFLDPVQPECMDIKFLIFERKK